MGVFVNVNNKSITITHEEGQAIKRAVWVLNTARLKSCRDPKIVVKLQEILEKLREN